MRKYSGNKTRFRNTGILIVLSLMVASITSCDSNKVYEEYIEVKNAVWEREQVANFEFDSKDTESPHNLYINIRNSGDYPYSNLYLFVTIKGPDGQFNTDTINIVLQDKRGKWYGKGVGDLYDYQKPFIGGFKFAQEGKYLISLEQAMRVENGLKGITDVGIRVEKAAENK